ncbi:hypothetical protein [Paenibacillus sp. XY044]|uniref:hypothetical protein n=1 Tax=Paenibacillus sp. XY044 TaxID=2026089 RepID=UPI000B9873B5|nr:hypothetical protein [Paenibacillus sp. XY044]OZB95198.1 hypothetical protein CJP46_16030 [Paenibacillus sp. XY044]
MIVKSSRILLTALMCLSAWLLMGFSTPSGPVKATWVWQTELIEDGGKELLSFAQNQGINLIYLQINRDLPANQYETFIKNAHADNIAVHALGGDPGWAQTKHRDRLVGLVDWVNDYNNAEASDARFDGIHLDIEPYVLPEWNTDPEGVIGTWIGNIQAFLDAAHASGSTLDLGIDLPFWFDGYTVPNQGDEKLTEWFMKSFDHVTILAYRNTVDSEHGIVELARDEMESAQKLGTKALVAVNTKQMPGEEHTSFYGSGKSEMDQSLKSLSAALESYTSYGGIAIHDFRNWENMPDGEEPGGSNPEPAPEPDPEPEKPSDGQVPDPDPVDRDKQVRGTYVWEANQVMEHGQEIIEFAKEKKLNWLFVRLDLQQPVDAYRSFVKEASAAGIEVHAMGGHPIWALTENRPKMMKLVNYVKKYNQEVAGDERFHGIHLDIEPYVLPEWRKDPDHVLEEWTGNMAAFVQEMKKDSNLQASMDLAVWLDKYKVPGTEESLSKWMIDKMDFVSLMAFRDTAGGSNGIAAVSKEEIAFANELGKPILISVEMKDSGEGNHITFAEEGSAYMEEELAKLPGLLADSPSYTGNVVHAYDYWKTAKP